MVKRTIAIIIIMGNVFLLSGCWNYTEIDSESLVAGLAVDKPEKDGKYHVTAEIVTLEAGGKESKMNSKLVEADGFTIQDAIRNMITVASQKLFFSHCKILIISSELAKDGIIPLIDIAFRDHELRHTVDVLIAEGCLAKDILAQESVSTPIKSYEIDKLLEVNKKSLSKSLKAEVYQIVNVLEGEGISLAVPVIKVEKISKYYTYALSGIAVFNKDKLIGFLNEEESRYFLFIINQIQGGAIPIKIINNYLSYEIFANKTNIKHKFENNQLKMNIQTKTTVSIGELGEEIDYISNLGFEKLKEKTEKSLEDNIRFVIRKVQSEFNSDIFGFGQSISKNNPSLWKKLKPTWKEQFKELNVNVKSEVKIRGSGIAEKPIKIGE